MTIAASDESQDPMFRPRWHQSTTHFKLIRLGCVAILIAKLIASAQQWHTHTHKWSTLKWSAFAEEADFFFQIEKCKPVAGIDPSFYVGIFMIVTTNWFILVTSVTLKASALRLTPIYLNYPGVSQRIFPTLNTFALYKKSSSFLFPFIVTHF